MNRVRRAWRFALGSSWGERRLLAKAWAMLILAAAGLALFGFRRMRHRLVRESRGAASVADVPTAQRVAQLVRAAAGACPLRATCLAQALVIYRLLADMGLAADLRIGVASNGDAVAAHAWVEHCGVALGERSEDLARFSPFNENILTRGA